MLPRSRFAAAFHNDGALVAVHQAGGLGGHADRLAGIDQVLIAVPGKAHGFGGDGGGVGQFPGGERIVLSPATVQGDGDMDRLVRIRVGGLKGKYAGGGWVLPQHRTGEGDGAFGLRIAIVYLVLHRGNQGGQGGLVHRHGDRLCSTVS